MLHEPTANSPGKPDGKRPDAFAVRRSTTALKSRLPSSSMSKRLFDILCAGFALLVFLPLLCLVVAAIYIESGRPIIFRQHRTGLNGRTFVILKFRTMRVMEDGAQVRQARQHDDRVTAVGAILRKFSVDELPQLLNVLRGDMSIVGPRPHAVSHDEQFAVADPAYRDRFRARPGLTGYAQVNGFRGSVKHPKDVTDRVAADNAYIDQWSIGLDLWIVLRTIPLLLHDPNAF